MRLGAEVGDERRRRVPVYEEAMWRLCAAKLVHQFAIEIVVMSDRGLQARIEKDDVHSRIAYSDIEIAEKPRRRAERIPRRDQDGDCLVGAAGEDRFQEWLMAKATGQGEIDG